ncbi:MAG: sulfatase-like hydrolase/transferase [Hyphomicrobiaceae bacterium]
MQNPNIAPTGAAASLAESPQEPRPALVRAWTAFIVAALGMYFWKTEGEVLNIVFTAAVTLAIGASIVFVSRRILIAAVLMAAMVTIVTVVSSVKQQTMNMTLHAYDLVFYLSSWSTVTYLWDDYRRYMIPLAAAHVAMAMAGWIAYRIDGTRIRRRYAAGAAVFFAGVAALAAAAKGDRRHTLFYFEDLYVSSFFSSWAETVETLWRRQLIDTAYSGGGGPKLTLPATCETAAKPPHIVLIHQESIVPPSYFPSLGYDRSLDPFFRSFDGTVHKLRVETYGGASWLTEFSLLTGLSTYSFGNMRLFAQSTMAGKVRDTLPQALARCGYRNVMFYPMIRNFVSNGRFYNTIGLHRMFDAKDQGAKRVNERDRFFYTNALAEMERHFETSPQPLFTFIMTMAAHGPYWYTYQPETDVPGGAPGTHRDMHEYLRRLAMARLDYDFFHAELVRRFPDQPFLIVHYGDHHPMATRTLLGFAENAVVEDVWRSGNSPAFITYYAVDGVNYQPPPLPALEAIDIPYLGTVMLEAARLPLSDAYRERKRLMAVCNGRYYGCANPNEILRFHRRLIDSGLMDAL